MRFFWRACGVCAFYGSVRVAWSCDPTLITYSHGLPVVRYLDWFFWHVGYLVLCFSRSVCVTYAAGSSAGSCNCLAQCCRGGSFFPSYTVFSLVWGFLLWFQEFSRLRFYSLAALVVWPFRSVCLSYASPIACGCWPWVFFSLRPSSLVVPAGV